MIRFILLLALLVTTAVIVSAAPPVFADDDADPCTTCNTDFDGDGDTDDADLALFQAAMGASDGDANFNAACDCNRDGVVGAPDFACVLRAASGH